MNCGHTRSLQRILMSRNGPWHIFPLTHVCMQVSNHSMLSNASFVQLGGDTSIDHPYTDFPPNVMRIGGNLEVEELKEGVSRSVCEFDWVYVCV
jgi:hypothetical protein